MDPIAEPRRSFARKLSVDVFDTNSFKSPTTYEPLKDSNSAHQALNKLILKRRKTRLLVQNSDSESKEGHHKLSSLINSIAWDTNHDQKPATKEVDQEGLEVQKMVDAAPTGRKFLYRKSSQAGLPRNTKKISHFKNKSLDSLVVGNEYINPLYPSKRLRGSRSRCLGIPHMPEPLKNLKKFDFTEKPKKTQNKVSSVRDADRLSKDHRERDAGGASTALIENSLKSKSHRVTSQPHTRSHWMPGITKFEAKHTKNSSIQLQRPQSKSKNLKNSNSQKKLKREISFLQDQKLKFITTLKNAYGILDEGRVTPRMNVKKPVYKVLSSREHKLTRSDSEEYSVPLRDGLSLYPLNQHRWNEVVDRANATKTKDSLISMLGKATKKRAKKRLKHQLEQKKRRKQARLEAILKQNKPANTIFRDYKNFKNSPVNKRKMIKRMITLKKGKTKTKPKQHFSRHQTITDFKSIVKKFGNSYVKIFSKEKPNRSKIIAKALIKRVEKKEKLDSFQAVRQVQQNVAKYIDLLKKLRGIRADRRFMAKVLQTILLETVENLFTDMFLTAFIDIEDDSLKPIDSLKQSNLVTHFLTYLDEIRYPREKKKFLTQMEQVENELKRFVLEFKSIHYHNVLGGVISNYYGMYEKEREFRFKSMDKNGILKGVAQPCVQDEFRETVEMIYEERVKSKKRGVNIMEYVELMKFKGIDPQGIIPELRSLNSGLKLAVDEMEKMDGNSKRTLMPLYK